MLSRSTRHSWLRWPSGTTDDLGPGDIVTRADTLVLVSTLHRSPLEARQWSWQTGVNGDGADRRKQIPLPPSGAPPSRALVEEQQAYRDISKRRREAIKEAKREHNRGLLLKAEMEMAEELEKEKVRAARSKALLQARAQSTKNSQEARLDKAFDETTKAFVRLLRRDPDKVRSFATKVLGENRQVVLENLTPLLVQALIRAGLTENNLAYARWTCGLEWRSWETLAVLQENAKA